jgi:hypothetical protein
MDLQIGSTRLVVPHLDVVIAVMAETHGPRVKFLRSVYSRVIAGRRYITPLALGEIWAIESRQYTSSSAYESAKVEREYFGDKT